MIWEGGEDREETEQWEGGLNIKGKGETSMYMLTSAHTEIQYVCNILNKHLKSKTIIVTSLTR